MTSAAILGCSGLTLSREEAAFFRDAQPWGFILFSRNVETPDQVRKLVDQLRATVGRPDAPVLIDQEGGRVQRLGPPHWRRYPPGRAYGDLPSNDPLLRREITRLGARLLAHDLAALGINVDCVPVLDVPVAGAHDVIGDRAYAKTPEGATLPGGMGVRFDWALLDGFRHPLPWALSGGLDAGNVAEAIRRTGATLVDVSSGVERAPGTKDPAKIAAFLKAAHG